VRFDYSFAGFRKQSREPILGRGLHIRNCALILTTNIRLLQDMYGGNPLPFGTEAVVGAVVRYVALEQWDWAKKVPQHLPGYPQGQRLMYFLPQSWQQLQFLSLGADVAKSHSLRVKYL